MLVKDYIPLILVDTENLPRDEWLEWRRKGIGGSDAATIIGVSPFSTARDLYYDKLNIVSAVDEENNWVQKEIGHLLEDLVAKIFSKKTGYPVYTLNIIENEPERLLEIKGITEQKLEDIKRTFDESYSVRSLMILLSPYNISPGTAIKIYDYFGAKSIDILSENPYRLCEMTGFGFKRVDAIVKKGDTPLNSPMRIQGAIITALDTV